MNKISDNQKIVQALKTTDIGGANATSAYVDMRECPIVCFVVTLGTWNAADTLDSCKLVQATDAAGTGVKDITGKAVTVEDPSAAGEVYVLECKAEDLDTENGFTHVACYVAESDDTGVDEVSIISVTGNARYKYENVLGATARI